MSVKKQCLPLSLVFILFLTLPSGAQDTWTDSWKLVWAYDAQLISDYHIIAFDVYKDISANSVTFFKSLDPSLREYRDAAIQPNTTYYYRLTVRDDSGRTSGYSQIVFESIPFIFPALDLIEFYSELNLNLSDPKYVIDKDLNEADYQNSLQWWINDGLTYTSADSVLNIRITNNSTVTFSLNQQVIGQDTVYFTVFDPDSFWYKKRSIIRYGVSPVTAIQEDSIVTADTEFSVYPMPFRAAVHQEIMFKNLPRSASLILYNVLGEPVYSVQKILERSLSWDVKNNAGREVSAGVYIYHILDEKGKLQKSGKLVVIR